MISAGGRRPPLLLVALPALAGLLVLLPLVYLGLRAGQADPSQALDLVFRARNAQLLANTLLLAAAVLASGIALALPTAWAVTRSNLPFRGAFTWIAAVPLAIPGYILAYAYLGLTGSNGILHRLIDLRVDRPEGFLGAWFILTVATAPYLFLNLRAAFLNFDPALEAAARSLGAGPGDSFRRVVLPQLKPAMASGGLIVLLHVLGDFGVVALMRFETFSYALYLQYAASFDRTYAAWLALILLALTVVLLLVDGRLVSRVRLHRAGSGVRRGVPLSELGRWRWPLAGALALFSALTVLAPVAAVVYWFLQSPGFSGSVFRRAIVGSLSAAGPAALAATLLAVPVVYLSVRYPSRLSRVLERSAYLGYATPPLALALAVIFFTLQAAQPLYQTLGLLIFAYVLHFQAEALGPMRSGLLAAPPRLEEAARSLGRGPRAAFLAATFPLLRRSLAISVAIVFLSAMKELPLTFLLSPPGFETLAVNVWSYTNEAMFAEAAPFALGILVVSGAAVGVLVARGRHGRVA